MTWMNIALKDLIDIHDHYRVPLSGVERQKRRGFYPYYGAQGIIDHVDAWLFDGEYILLAEDGENLRSRKEPVAQIVCGKFWVNNHAHIISAKDEVSNNKFVCTLLNWLDINPYITGAAQPKLSQGSIKKIMTLAPDKETQDQISKVFSGYDDLIATNQRRIRLLEESARLLYREWFVCLRFPGHETVPVMAGVPEGWDTCKLSEVADVNASTITAKDHPESIRYVDISSVEIGEIGDVDEIPFEEAPGRARRQVQHGDIIWSCVRPNRRSYALIWEPQDNLIVSTGFAVLTTRTIPFSYLYLASTTDDFVSYLTNQATGAAYPAVSAKDFEKASILLPDTGTLAAFDKIVLPVLEQIDAIKCQNKILREARDMLLPKLMSGALDVSRIAVPKEVEA